MLLWDDWSFVCTGNLWTVNTVCTGALSWWRNQLCCVKVLAVSSVLLFVDAVKGSGRILDSLFDLWKWIQCTRPQESKKMLSVILTFNLCCLGMILTSTIKNAVWSRSTCRYCVHLSVGRTYFEWCQFYWQMISFHSTFCTWCMECLCA